MVPQVHRRRALPDRRHVVADRDRRDHDHAAAGHRGDEARLGDAGRSPASTRRSSNERGNEVEVGGGYLAHHQPVAVDAARHLAAIPSATCSSTGRSGPGIYFTGDGAKRDEDGYFWLLGRVDDVINVAGHRIGTMEVESALVDHPAVAEAAVVGIKHEIKGTAIAAFVIVKASSAEKRNAIRRSSRRS